MQTRKQFLLNSASLASGAALLGFNGMGILNAPSPVSFDLHCHPGRLFEFVKGSFGDIADPDKTLNAMNAAHLSGAFFTLVADSKFLKLGPTGITVTGKYGPGEAWTEYKRQLKGMKDFLQKASVAQSIKASDLKPSPSVIAYLAVEGGDFLEGKLENLDKAYHDGIRSIQLVHYVPNDLGDLQTADSMHNGLSAFGKEVVRKMNKLGIVIDTAHASYQTTKDVAGLSDSPILLSHSILEMEPDRPLAKRAISKEHAKIVAQTGGLIGAWPSGFNKSFDEYVENTLRLVEVAGIDHVGIGTDMDGNFKPVLSDYSQYPVFAEALKNKGLAQNEVDKIMGGNVTRLMGKVFKN